MSINLIDLLLVGIFVAIIGFGFFNGVVRLLLVTISLYLSVVVSGLFYVPFAAAVTSRLAAITPFTAQLVAFCLLALLSTVALAFTLFRTFATVQLPAGLASFDQIGGAMGGVVAATFTAVVASVVLRVFLSLATTAQQGGIAVSPLLLGLAEQRQASFMARYFLELAAPVFALIAPWFPNGLPPLLGLN